MTTGPFQARVAQWMRRCFGETISADRQERSMRFFEEASELVQAGGLSREHAHSLVDYVYDRPVGEIRQEVGGVGVTLAAFCSAHDINLDAACDTEIERCWQMIEKIRAKQQAKPRLVRGDQS